VAARLAAHPRPCSPGCGVPPGTSGCSIRRCHGVPGACLRWEQRPSHAARGHRRLFLWVCRGDAGRALCSKWR